MNISDRGGTRWRLWAALVALTLFTNPAHGQTPAPPQQASQEAGAIVARYCGTCHSARTHTANLVLDPEAFAQIPAHADRWEKVIRKLQSKTMPPPGAPRPDRAAYDSLQSYLESELDKAAAAQPNPGKLPLLHRLTRTEYQNAVRDLLLLESLPKDMDYTMLLPQDNPMSGFDNIADLLFVSPTAMESYLGAAEKISRLAIGDPSAPAMFNTYNMPDEHPQTSRYDERMPYGTRGGMAIKSYFPLDGEYVINVVFIGNAEQEQKLEISVDGERLRLEVIPASTGRGGRGGGFGGRGAAPAANAPARSAGQGDDDSSGGRSRDVRVPIKAGQRMVQVTFIQPSEARDEQVVRPRLRGVGPTLGIQTVTISGPYQPTGAGDTPTRQRIFVCRPSTAAEEEPCARRIMSSLARRAYRRPVTNADLQPLMPFYHDGRAEGGFDRGIQRALQRLLMSPQFLFRIERDAPKAAAGSSHPVTDLELASRLSFFLWSSIPDDELLALATQGRLRQPTVLAQQVRRMLADARSISLVTNFAEQWLYLRDIEEKRPNEILFPDFDESLRKAFHTETVMFVDSVLRGKGSVLDLLAANYTFVNERLAQHYGIPNIRGAEFRRVTFPAGSPRGGLLGQGSLLTITSYANRTSPVNRGKWVLENLLSSPPPPPPPNVPALKTEGESTRAPLTMREAMIQHRANPACAGCHSRMDPIGFAMEHFDPIGQWRERDGGQPIDASGVFPDGTTFDGTAGLKAALLSHPAEFVSTVTEKLLMFALGRNVQYFDQPAIRAIVKASAASRYTFESLVLGVVTSVPFQQRQVESAAETTVAGRQ